MCRSRLIIYSRVYRAKLSDADVYRVRSDYFLPLAPISHANLRDRQKLALRRDARRFVLAVDRYQLQLGRDDLFRPRAPIALIFLVAAIRRGSLCAPRSRRDTGK